MSRTAWPALLASALLLAALQLWLRPLLPVDETRYLSVAWEMWWRGDFLVPYLNGEPYSHKPPLLFWLVHGVWALSGVSELAARLLPVLLSVLALWMSAGLASRLWPRQAASVRALVPWLLLGGLFWNNFFTLFQFDLLLVIAALLAWFGVLEALRAPLRGWLLVGAATGLGILAKGPVILVPVLPAVLLAPWWARDSRPAGWLAWYGGGLFALLLAAGIALSWAIPAAMAGGEAYRQAIFWGQSAGRMVSSFAHPGAWWSYLLWLPLMWLPWVLWPSLWKAALRGRPADDGIRFCAAVMVPALLIFSLISGKQGKYLLPLLPLAALLCARWLAAADHATRRYRLHYVGMLLVLTGLLLLALPWLPAGADWFQQVQLLWGPALLVWGAVCFALKLELAAAVRAAALAMLLWTATLYLALIPLLAPQYDLAPISRVLSSLQVAERKLAWLGKYHGQFHFLGRLQGRIEAIDERGRLSDWLDGNADGYLLVNYKSRRPDIPDDLLIQPYRGGSLVLWPASRLLQDPPRLDALSGNA
jgi:4-amino-4-deoxy-L-arabinose transferase-like glycosyltransferase